MSRKSEKASVALPSDGEVLVSRTFAARRDLVYQAYTTPELVQRWLLGPPGWSMPVCDMDVREGGTFRWRWRSDEDGSEFGFHGRFLEVDPPALIRHTEHYDQGDMDEDMGDGEAMVTVRFTERDGRTTVTTLIDYGSREARDAALATGMTDGMEMSYQLLEGLLGEGAGES